MMRLAYRATLIAVLSAVLVLWMRDKSGTTHVVIVTLGSTRVDHLQIYSERRPTSPRLVQLAAHSVVFEQAFAASADTAPAHASLLTGLQVPAHGVARDGMPLDKGVTTLPEILRQAGYRTGAFVSTPALGGQASRFAAVFDVYDDGGPAGQARRGDRTMNAAMGWLEGEAHQREPNLLLVHLADAEAPYEPPIEHTRPFTRSAPKTEPMPPEGADLATKERYARHYAGEIRMIDHQLGRLIETLQRCGFWEETLLVVVADHGQSLAERSAAFTHGGMVVEEQIRVPLLIRFPRDRFGGTRVDSPVHQVDVLPTLLSSLGLPQVNGHGGSLMGIVRGQTSRSRETPVYTTTSPIPERVPAYPVVQRGLVTALRRWPYKLVSYPIEHNGRVWELFDLQKDPRERQDTWESAPKLLKAQLKEQLTHLESIAGLRQPQLHGPDQDALRRGLGYTQ